MLMNPEQLSEMVFGHNREIAAMHESLKSAHHRIDTNDEITAGIHKLAANMEALTMQVKLLTERMESSLMSMETRLKTQGERIGALENKPGKRWEAVAEKVLLVFVGGIATFFMTKMGL